MKKFILLILVIILCSCNTSPSLEELSGKVEKDIYIEFTKFDPNFKIESFDLIHVEGKKYNGILKSSKNGFPVAYSIDVTLDGDKYLLTWKKLY